MIHRTRSRRINRFVKCTLGNRRADGLTGEVGDCESMPVFGHVLGEEFALGFCDAEFEGGWLAGTVSCGEGTCAL